ncbi:hypothetical protein VPNG_01228 [Cytospora leucostoma]|uniref:Post-SET domain-containing protein n=1 Tax=Cytospora leucostoma TaxID=1230097 RepID=A0A423XKR4_9PEZI|nr:hypothetical protein VPNG_01228 [Cytospora leucostoma]
MAPLEPHWQQPSHPDIQEVINNEGDFASKSISRIAVAPFGVYADLAASQCTIEDRPTYATCQIGRNKHISLNSDLLYMNHSCEPSLRSQFFYPSTEWELAQPFDCSCGTPSCHDRIAGARDMTISQLEGYWLSGHIRELKKQQQEHAGKDATTTTTTSSSSSSSSDTFQADGETPPPPTTTPPAAEDLTVIRAHNSLDAKDPTVQALNDALDHAEKVVEAARTALVSYIDVSRSAAGRRIEEVKGERVKHRGTFGEAEGSSRRGGGGEGSG